MVVDQNRSSTAIRDEPIISTARTMHSTLIQNCFRSFCFCVDIPLSSFPSVRRHFHAGLKCCLSLLCLVGVNGLGQLIRAGSVAAARYAPQDFLHFIRLAANYHPGQALGIPLTAIMKSAGDRKSVV